APHGFEKNLIKPAWSSDGSQIAAGSSDRTVVIWDVSSRRILYKLPGHKGSVNEVDFHPKEPITLEMKFSTGLSYHNLPLFEVSLVSTSRRNKNYFTPEREEILNTTTKTVHKVNLPLSHHHHLPKSSTNATNIAYLSIE
ncbi:6621_t:CDS:2, partial [Dentiscutata erythropus]